MKYICSFLVALSILNISFVESYEKKIDIEWVGRAWKLMGGRPIRPKQREVPVPPFSLAVEGVEFPGVYSWCNLWQNLAKSVHWKGKKVLDLSFSLSLPLIYLSREYEIEESTCVTFCSSFTQRNCHVSNFSVQVVDCLMKAFGVEFINKHFNILDWDLKRDLEPDFDVVIVRDTAFFGKHAKEVNEFIVNIPIVVCLTGSEKRVLAHYGSLVANGYSMKIVGDETAKDSSHVFVFFNRDYMSDVNVTD